MTPSTRKQMRDVIHAYKLGVYGSANDALNVILRLMEAECEEVVVGCGECDCPRMTREALRSAFSSTDLGGGK